MGRPRQYDRRVSVMVRVPQGLRDRLEAAANDRDISMNKIATKAIETYLATLPRADEDPRLQVAE